MLTAGLQIVFEVSRFGPVASKVTIVARFEEVSKLTTDCIKVLDSGDVEVTFPSAKNYNFSNK